MFLGFRVFDGIKTRRLQRLFMRSQSDCSLLLRLGHLCLMVEHSTCQPVTASAATTVPSLSNLKRKEAFVGRGPLHEKACDVAVHARILDPPMMFS